MVLFEYEHTLDLDVYTADADGMHFAWKTPRMREPTSRVIQVSPEALWFDMLLKSPNSWGKVSNCIDRVSTLSIATYEWDKSEEQLTK